MNCYLLEAEKGNARRGIFSRCYFDTYVYGRQIVRRNNATYFLPIPEEIACLSSETKKSRGGTELRRIVLKKDMITSKTIFRIAGFLHSYVIGRMDLVESVL